ncbi:putative peptidoglycan lipid II flippase [Brevibacterium sanguinis]|uniref:Peptidoglycan lipid II flippase n=2 Tax=Brevibacterium TaxID=1696 RepID=A0ABX9GKF4_9MICO|nr:MULTISPECIES: lipid II flippase MurJ [Brevibacterium]RBP61882.1 putative peptidoglycan lipid II flippase [Brevibacterium sanguinis]RBP68672.1 putative peptidoglycan lipid II flippase [Brevibacterium celere]
MSRLVRVFASAALLVSLITLLTRLVGFLRWLVFSPTVGATTVGNAYQTANQVPNILFEVVAGGALAGAVVPLLAIPLSRADTETASRIASALLTWAISVTLPLSVVLAVFARPIAGTLLGAGDPGLEQTAIFLLMFSPQLVLYGIGAVLTGVLQAHRKFLWPAFAPLLSSLVVIGCYIAYAVVGGSDDTWRTHIGWLGWGTTIGVAALALPLALPMRSTGLRIRPTWSFPPGVAHRALRLAGAGMAALFAQQAAVLTTLKLSNASGGTGTFVLFSYINAVYLLPYAVLAVPVATVMFPSLSSWVGRTRDVESTPADRAAAEVRLRQLTSTTTAIIISIGALGAVILFSAALPLQWFFTAIDAAGAHGNAPFGSMSQAIMVMALAVPGWSLVAWGTRVFYAMERSRHSAVATTTGWILVIVGMVLAILLTDANGESGLTLVAICIGYALGMSVAGGLLVFSLRRILGPTGLARVGRRGLISLFAAVVAGVAGVLISRWMVGETGTTAAASVINGVVSALIGCAVFAFINLLDRRYITEVRGLLAGRRGDGAQNGPPGTSNPTEAHPAEASNPSTFENPSAKHKQPRQNEDEA